MEFEIDKVLYMNELFAIYGDLLSLKQYQIFSDYYQENLSLSELAENLNISRNAVYDALKKAEKSLMYYEEKLHLYAKNEELEQKIDKLYEAKHIDEFAFKELKGE